MKNRVWILALIAICACAGAANAAHRHHMNRAPGHKGPYETRATDPTPCAQWPVVDTDGDGVPDRLDHCLNTPLGCTVDDYGCEYDTDGDGVCDGRDKCPNTPEGSKVNADGCDAAQLAAGREGRNPGAVAPESKPVSPPVEQTAPPSRPQSEIERKLLETGSIRLERVYFETNSANLLPESEATLNEAGEALEKFPDLQIEVQGHTDTRGSNAYNQKLSQARAESVRSYLLAHFQLSADNLVAKGYGESQPETKERNEEELLRNRRVVLKVLNPDALPRGVKVEEGKK
jgi:OOP family OmpA-OmpF porin